MHGAVAAAQVADGTLGGVVADPAGRPLAGASVMVRSVGTNLRRTTTTGDDGSFVFPSLPAGEWKAEASLRGYTVALVGEVYVHVAQTRRLRLILEPSEFQEMVTQADYRPLARIGTDLGAWVTPAEITNLPLRTRTVADLASLVPLPAAPMPAAPMPAAPVPAAPQQTLLDGGPVAPGSVPLSAVEEAALLSHSYGPELGGTGGVVSLVTRTAGATEASLFGHFADDFTGAGSDLSPGRRQLGATFGGSPRPDVHLFGAWERHDFAGDGADRDWLTAHASWHDASQLARLRYLGSDVEGGARTHALLASLQSRPFDGLLNDFRVQRSSSDTAADLAGDDLVQIRDDLYMRGPSSGRHELATGAESLSAGSDSSWALYARERWKGHDRLTVTAALRSQQLEAGGRRQDGLSPRLAVAWSLDDGGNHLLRSAAGRYRATPLGPAATAETLGSSYADHVSLGWSWQMSPFLGLNVDAVSVEYGASEHVGSGAGSATMGGGAPPADAPADYEAVGFTVRSRFSDVFQVRASMSWIDGGESALDHVPNRERAVVTGVYHAPAEILLAAVYRHGAEPVAGSSDEAGAARDGLDLRLSKLLPLGGEASVEIMAEVFDVFEESSMEGAERSGQLGLRLRF